MTENPLQSFAPMRFLVVDDDPMVTEILSAYYESIGFIVEMANDGQAALRAMEARLPDVVICDRMMPGVSGVQLLEEIRQRGESWQTMVFVFLTSLTDSRDRHAMLPLRPDGYLHKPINFADADKILAGILKKRNSPPSTS